MSDTTTPSESKAAPVPAQPSSAPSTQSAENVNRADYKLDPTRYGDWEKNGRCIDF